MSPATLLLPRPTVPPLCSPAKLPRSWHCPDPEGKSVAEVASHVICNQSAYVLCSPVMKGPANDPQVCSAFFGLPEVNSCLENRVKKALMGKYFQASFSPAFCVCVCVLGHLPPFHHTLVYRPSGKPFWTPRPTPFGSGSSLLWSPNKNFHSGPSPGFS